jgi:uncharacterized membrane protein YqjE
MIFRVGLTIAPILLGVFILSQGNTTSDCIMAAILIVAGILVGIGFWWDVRRSRHENPYQADQSEDG